MKVTPTRHTSHGTWKWNILNLPTSFIFYVQCYFFFTFPHFAAYVDQTRSIPWGNSNTLLNGLCLNPFCGHCLCLQWNLKMSHFPHTNPGYRISQTQKIVLNKSQDNRAVNELKLSIILKRLRSDSLRDEKAKIVICSTHVLESTKGH